MPTLVKNTFATLIHGITRQRVAECWLDKGTPYRLLGPHPDPDWPDARIIVNDEEGTPFEYQVYKRDLTTTTK